MSEMVDGAHRRVTTNSLPPPLPTLPLEGRALNWWAGYSFWTSPRAAAVTSAQVVSKPEASPNQGSVTP